MTHRQRDIDGAVDPSTASQATVLLDGRARDFGTDWQLIDADTMELFGDACQTYLAAPEVSLSASFPCPR